MNELEKALERWRVAERTLREWKTWGRDMGESEILRQCRVAREDAVIAFRDAVREANQHGGTG